MAHAKMSVTVPEDILNEIKEIVAAKKTRLSKVVTEALADKVRKTREEAIVLRINKVFDDPEALKEQLSMADDIADHTDIRELPW